MTGKAPTKRPHCEACKALCDACRAGLPLETDAVTGRQFHVAQVGEDEYEQLPHTIEGTD